MSSHETPKRLSELREALDLVDQSLISLAAQRQQIVSDIGAIKAQEGRQLRDFRREREVLDGVRGQAKSLGLDPNLAEDLIARLIEASLTRQEQEQVRRAHRGEGRDALVIGGAGRLGRWLVNFLDAQGYAVTIADPELGSGADTHISGPHVTEWQAAGLDFDVVVLATPPGITASLLQDIATANPTGLIFDVGSIKSPLIDALAEVTAQGLKVCSVHPMFGPSTALLSGRHVLLMNTGNDQALVEARALFSDTMAETVVIPIEAHDRMMALVLGLSHAINIAFLAALVEAGVPASELAKLSSTTFERQMAIARDVIDESPLLYYEIQKLNTHGNLARNALSHAVELIQQAVAADDPKAFVELMQRGRQYVQSLDCD